MHETIRPANVFRILEKRFWIEIADFTRDLTIVVRNVERGDFPDAAFAFLEVRPKRFEIVPDWRDDAHSGDYDSSIVVHLMIQRFIELAIEVLNH
jgi:hypothetical protein